MHLDAHCAANVRGPADVRHLGQTGAHAGRAAGDGAWRRHAHPRTQRAHCVYAACAGMAPAQTDTLTHGRFALVVLSGLDVEGGWLRLTWIGLDWLRFTRHSG